MGQLRSGQFRGQKGLGPLEKSRELSHYEFCLRKENNISHFPNQQYIGNFMSQIERERERDQEQEREREQDENEKDSESKSEKKSESERGKGKGQGKGQGKGKRKRKGQEREREGEQENKSAGDYISKPPGPK
jgi:hypothetical protein